MSAWRKVQAWRRQRQLPNWLSAVIKEDMTISINCDKAWPHFVNKLQAKGYETRRDQYWWAVFRRCVTALCRDTLKESVNVSLDGTKVPNIPEGLGREAGANEFRKYYKEFV